MSAAALFMLLAGGSPQPSTFVGASGFVGNTTLTLPSGWQAGDIALVLTMSASGAAALTGSYTSLDTWTISGPGYTGALFWRLLQAGDSSPVLSGTTTGGAQIAVYRGGTTATLKNRNTTAGTGGPLALTGFTKAAASRKIISMYAANSTSASTVPSGFTSDATYTDGGNWGRQVASVNPAAYTNSAGVTWGGLATSQEGVLLELT